MLDNSRNCRLQVDGVHMTPFLCVFMKDERLKIMHMTNTTTTFVCACSLLDYCSLQVDGVLMTPFQCGAERLKIAAEKLFDSTQF